jgi:hypothetical protein
MKVLISLLMICAFLNVHGQIDTITWTPLSSLPDPTQRVISGYFLIDSDFFVAGGQAGGSGTLNTVWKYHIPTDSWIQMQNLPFGASASGGSFVLNGMGYFLTARDSISNFNCDTLFWMYDPSSRSPPASVRRIPKPPACIRNNKRFISHRTHRKNTENQCRISVTLFFNE